MREILIVALVASACRPAPPVAPFTLRIAVSGPLDPMSPRADIRSWTSYASPVVFQTLLTLGLGGEIVPLLASRVEAGGPRELRVWLSTSARFSDGSALTVPDVVESLKASGLQSTPEGDHLLVTSPEPGIPTELLVSRAYVFRRVSGGFLGTGPFTVTEQDASHIVFTRVVAAPPRIARIRLDSYATPQDAFARTLKGDADLLPDVQPRWVEFFEGVPRLRVLRAPGATANMVAFNRDHLDRRARAALQSVLSTDEIRRLAFGDDCIPPARRPGIEPLPPGRPLDVIGPPFYDRFAFAVRRALGPRGGSVRTTEIQDLFALLKQGDYDLAMVRPRVSPPIMASLNWRTGAATNVLHYSNPAVDAALDRHDWAAAQRALEEDPPGVIICTQPALVVIDSRIKKVSFDSSFRDSIPQWEVAQ